MQEQGYSVLKNRPKNLLREEATREAQRTGEKLIANTREELASFIVWSRGKKR